MTNSDLLHPCMDETELGAISNLGLAHMGDAVYEMLVRTWLCTHGCVTSKGLHRETVRFVSAPAQARAMEVLLPRLTEAEAAVYKRGRNTRVHSVPQHADISEYHAATGLEALFGWLYLRGDTARVEELFQIIMRKAMPLDAVCLAALTRELRGRIIGMRIDKVQQPERDLLLLSLRGMGSSARLLICAGVGNARLHLTSESFEQPAQPPMFCMLLRKHLVGARIVDVVQPAFERLVHFELDALDELGAPIKRRLTAELMGRNSNLILSDESGRIIDCLRRVDAEMSEKRQVLPGLLYRLPPRQDRPCFFDCTPEERRARWNAAPPEQTADQWLLDTFSGLSPLICRELCHRAFGESAPRVGALPEPDKLPLAMEALAESVAAGEYTPCLLLEADRPRDFSFMPIRQYGAAMRLELFESFSALLEAYYGRRDRAERMKRRSQALTKTVRTARDRLARKLAGQREELRKTEGREVYRRQGDLITAHLWKLKKGDSSLTCEDYFQADCPEISIPLDPLKTPQQNAAKCYKEYNRLKAAEAHLTEQVDKGEKELAYLDSVLDELSRAEGEKELAEIRRELTGTGYLRVQKSGKRERPAEARPMRFVSSTGLEILVGRNNTQNDRLTLRDARRTDVWLHTQKIHGSHVIIRCGGEEPDEQTLTEAACLAVWYSQARGSGKVPVDYTQARFVKKPSGALPGMVIYTDYRTRIANPTEADILAIEQKN